MTFDPPQPPEPGEENMRAKNLKNLPIIIRPEKFGERVGRDGDPYGFISCTVWVIDSAGVQEKGERVEFSWWRATKQLSEYVGKGAFIACRPVEQDDNSIILMPLAGAARKVAEQVITDLQAEQSTPDPAPAVPVPEAAPPASEYDTMDEEPF